MYEEEDYADQLCRSWWEKEIFRRGFSDWSVSGHTNNIGKVISL